MIPLFKIPDLVESNSNLQTVVDSGWISNGEFIKQFESEFRRQFVNPKLTCTTVGSCTDALEIALTMIKRRTKKRQILLPALNFVASLNKAVNLGFTPKFYDIEDQFNPKVDEEMLMSMLTEDTAAVILVHFAGYTATTSKCLSTIINQGIMIIEDCAHAPGAKYDTGEYVGSLGTFGCFSFFSNKNIPAGEGGMLVATEEIIQDAYLIKNHGMTITTADRYKDSKLYYDVVRVGGNFRMTEFSAAFALPQMKRYADTGIVNRRHIVDQYIRNLTSDRCFVCFANQDIQYAAPHILPVYFESEQLRNSVARGLGSKNVQYSLHYPANNNFSIYGDIDGFHEKTDKYCERTLTLPLYDELSSDEVSQVSEIVMQVTNA